MKKATFCCRVFALFTSRWHLGVGQGPRFAWRHATAQPSTYTPFNAALQLVFFSGDNGNASSWPTALGSPVKLNLQRLLWHSACTRPARAPRRAVVVCLPEHASKKSAAAAADSLAEARLTGRRLCSKDASMHGRSGPVQLQRGPSLSHCQITCSKNLFIPALLTTSRISVPFCLMMLCTLFKLSLSL